MKLTQSLDKLIAEATARQIYDKYYSNIPELGRRPFIQIVSADPKTIIKGDGDTYDIDRIVKIGKYSKILLNMYIKGELQLEDLPRATEYLEYVYKYQIPIDNRDVRNLSDIYRIVSRYIVKTNNSFDTLLQYLNPDEYDKVYETDKWAIYIPKTEKSACYLGVNTEWCTSWGKHSLDKRYKQRENYFNNYIRKGQLYVIVNKTDFSEKYQFHFESKQFMDTSDSRINIENFFSDPDKKKLLNFFIPGLFKKLTNNDELQNQLKRVESLGSKLFSVFLARQYGEKFSNNKLVKCLYTTECDDLNNENIRIVHTGGGFASFYIDISKYYGNDVFNRVTEVGSDVLYSKLYNIRSLRHNSMYEYMTKKDFIPKIIEEVLIMNSDNELLINYFGYDPNYRHYFPKFYEQETLSKYTKTFANLVLSVSSEYLDSYFYYHSNLDKIVARIKEYVDFAYYTGGDGAPILVMIIPTGKLVNFILEKDIDDKYDLYDILGFYYEEYGIDRLLDEYYENMAGVNSNETVDKMLDNEDFTLTVWFAIKKYLESNNFTIFMYNNFIKDPMLEFSQSELDDGRFIYYIVGDYEVRFLDLFPLYLDDTNVDILVKKIGSSKGQVIKNIDVNNLSSIKQKLNISEVIDESVKTYKRIMDKF